MLTEFPDQPVSIFQHHRIRYIQFDVNTVQFNATNETMRRKYLIIGGGSALLTTAAGISLGLYGFYYKFYHTEIIPPVHDADARFIYIDRRQDDLFQDVHDRLPIRVDRFLPEIFRPTNLLDKDSTKPFLKRRVDTIDELTRHQWTDADSYVIAQKAFSDPALMVAIARSEVFNPKLLFRPATLNPDVAAVSLKDKLFDILKECKPSSRKLKQKQQAAVSYAQRKPGRLSPPSDNDVLKKLLETFAGLSEDPACCKSMQDAGIIVVVSRLLSEAPGLTKDGQHQISRMLANISAYSRNDGLVELVCRSGIVSHLAYWANSADLELVLRAGKALANLDLEFDENSVYSSGVYLLHPIKRTRASAHFDIVFVHGLRGSVFKTWRQNVKSRTAADKGKDHSLHAPYPPTTCWPKDWLSVDFPSSRILAVDYETSFVVSTFPALESEDFKNIGGVSERRAEDLLGRLKTAGVGSRPIIWVSHSMGGILVKQMLLHAQRNSDEFGKILEQTAACVFFSVPHRGSPVAEAFARYVHVSPEVHDLRINNPYLLTLQEDFARLVGERKINLLSFGETRPDYRIISTRFVPVESANPKIGRFVELNEVTHFYSCKPSSPQTDPIYTELVQFIKDCILSFASAHQ